VAAVASDGGELADPLLSAFADSVDALEPLTQLFLRANGYSLAAALGASADSIGSSGPGAFGGPFVGGGQAVAVLAALGLGFVTLTGWLLRRRDI
jgi:ABC-2 type transport system permease protein